MRIDKNTTIRLGDRNIVKVKIGDVVIWQKQQDNTDYLYIQNTYSGSNTITFTTTQSGTPASGTYATSVECSKNKSTWNTIHFDTSNPQTITLEQGEKLYLRNNTGVFNFHDVRNGTVDYYTSITSTNTINVGGNTNSLFDYTNMSGVDVSSTVGGLCRLFSHSVNLINANDIVIPQTTYPDFFVDEMFTHCESLVTAPNLNNVVNIGCASCSQMFGYCYSLVTPPDFNSVTYTGPRSGFSWCFYDCNSLTRTPSFNSLTSIGPLGFNRAFTNCSNLTDIMFDTSNITSLPENALSMSFMNTKIETGLHLGKVTELGKSSLYQLYRNCSFLSAVYCPNVSSWDTSITNNWLSGAGTSVSGTKTAYKYSNISIPTSDSGIPSGWTVVGPDYFYIENTYNGSNTISVKQTITGTPDSSLYAKTLQYSKDKTNWSTITLSSTAYTITLNQGERVYFRGNEGVFNHYVLRGTKQAYTNITANQSHNVGGNINTLVNYYNPNNLTLSQGVFCNVFRNDANLVSAENLTLQPSSDGSVPVFAYLYLFSNCTSLTKPPVLVAKTLSKGSYYSLFDGCSKLVNAPDLPATTLATNCYRALFARCTSLVNAPALPATTLADGCYKELFYGCSKLNNVTVYANDISATNCISDWLSGVASSGTFRNLGTATYPTGVSGIPSGWTEVKS